MPRDSNGNYQLPVGNPVVSGTRIESDWANSTTEDMAGAMSDSLSRSGAGAMLAPLKAFSGTVDNPGLTWHFEPDSGWYRAGDGDFRFSINGEDVFVLTGGGTNLSDIFYQYPATGSVPRTVQEKLDTEGVHTLDFGTDPTGVATSLADFQDAINSTPDGSLQVVHVARGDYKGKMETLNYGNRQIIFDEETGVRYLEGFPSRSAHRLRNQPPLLFSDSIIPAKHLRSFSTRPASAGSGATVTATVAAGAITGFTVVQGGTGWVTPRVLITGDGSGAEAVATVAGGAVTALTRTTFVASYTFVAGADYTNGTYTLIGSGGGGSGATAIVTVAGGAITSVVLGARGKGYTAAPTFNLAPLGAGTGGSITAVMAPLGGVDYTATTVYIVEGPVVVLVGDSIATEEPNPSVPGASLWGYLQSTIKEQNPRRGAVFFNRAIGGQTFTNLNGLANSFPSWYTNQSRDWIEYIRDLQPDLVIIAFGMNDRQNFIPAQARSAFLKIGAFTEPPDIVLVTSLVPSAISADPNISSAASQIGRDFVSGYVRGYALAEELGLLDLNRQCRLVRDGFDVRTSALRLVTVSGAQALPWTAAVEASDFFLQATFNAIPGGWWTERKINTKISPDGVNATLWARVEDSGGLIKISIIEVYTGPPSETVQFTVTSGLATPITGNVVVTILVQDQYVEVRVNGTVVFSRVIYRCGGTFLPVLNTAAGVNPTIEYAPGEYARYTPRLTDYEMWGYGGGADPYQGNALNHPTSVAVAHIIAPVVTNANWEASPITFGTVANSSTTFVGGGIREPKYRQHFVKKPMAVPVTAQANANVLVIEDADAVGLSLLSDNVGVARIIAGDSDNSNQWVQAYNHVNDTYSEVLGGVILRTLSAVIEVLNVPLRKKSYAKASLPNANNMGAGAEIFVTDDVGGPTPAFSDGDVWRRVSDRAVIS